jgi:hypothetical protein
VQSQIAGQFWQNLDFSFCILKIQELAIKAVFTINKATFAKFAAKNILYLWLKAP